MSKKPIRQQVRQGHTRWQVVLYKPGTFIDYPDQYVAKVLQCFVTAAFGTTVKYDCQVGPYIVGRQNFLKNTFSSFRKAMREGQRLVDQAVWMHENGIEGEIGGCKISPGL